MDAATKILPDGFYTIRGDGLNYNGLNYEKKKENGGHWNLDN